MEREQVINILQEIAMIMELRGDNPFKIRAYNAAAQALKRESRPIVEIIAAKELTKIKGIGKGLSEAIIEMIDMGESLILAELREGIPDDVVQMLKIPGLGVKKVKMIYEQLQISTIEGLRRACEDGTLAQLPGFAEKTAKNILASLESLQKYSGLFLYAHAEEEAQQLIDWLQNSDKVVEVQFAGELRRQMEVIARISLVVAVTSAKAIAEVLKSLQEYQETKQILDRGKDHWRIQLHSGLSATVKVVTKAQFPYALLLDTGNDKHYQLLQQRAAEQNMDLQQSTLTRAGKTVVCTDETAIYNELGLAFIVPELREGEHEFSEVPPRLVEAGDLQGILHMHTLYSDGQSSIRDMALAACQKGFSYIGITDHSQSLTIARGMKPELVLQQMAEIDSINAELQPFRIFKGIESDILPDGSLDYDDDILARFDFVIASIHSHFRMSQAEMTRRVIHAMENPYTTMLGHPTGRLLLRREPFAIDMKAIIDAAVANNVIIEINAHPQRLDLDWRLGRYARERQLMTSINPDAHSIPGLELMRYGVGIARKAWFEPQRVLNTFSCEKIAEFFAQRKAKSGS